MTPFSAHADCTLCPLFELSKHPGIPTRAADFHFSEEKVPLLGKDKALLFVGQNPGVTEDTEGKSWLGWAGKFLHTILHDVFEFHLIADVYLANSARCSTVRNKAPSKSARWHCAIHLRADLEALVSEYGEGNVYLIGMGAPAVHTLTGLSIKKAVAAQGLPRKLPWWDDGPAFPVFSTYHPAALAPGRDPSLLNPLEAHLRYLHDTLTGKSCLPTLPSAPLIAPSGPPELPPFPRIALDIETYGILEGKTQTVFNPSRMMSVDSVPRDEMVVCVALSWRGPDNHFASAWYRWDLLSHRTALASFLSALPPDATLVGMNLCFDLSVLRAADPRLAQSLHCRRFQLDDVAILNHLDSDMRPERSLKATARLFRTMDYDAMKVTAKGGHATGPDDPNLMLYNVADTIATLRNSEQHLANIASKHGPSHPALSPAGAEFRSQLLWVALHMDEAGVEFDRAAVQRVQDECVGKVEALIEEAYRLNLIVAGTGSEKSIREMVTAALLEANLMDDERVEYTKEERKVGTGKKNIHLLLSNLPLSSALRHRVSVLESYRTFSKLISSYTRPLLTEPDRGLVGSRAYPTWFPVPSHAKDSSDSEGGTRQGRFSAKDPAMQTPPSPIMECLVSRYGDEGILAAWDESQVELRTAALLSGDPTMMQAYCTVDEHGKNLDLHHLTACAIFPGLSKSDPQYKEKRQVGKRVNFLALYRGGWKRLVESVRMDIGWELSDTQAKAILYNFDSKYHVFRAWQDRELARAGKDGYLLLLSGWKRTFLGGPDAVRDSYINEVANMPVQTYAAQAVQSAQFRILDFRQARRLPFVMPAQIHDSVLIDCHRDAWPLVSAEVPAALEHPPFWNLLQSAFGREVPLVADRKILYIGSKVWPRPQ